MPAASAAAAPPPDAPLPAGVLELAWRRYLAQLQAQPLSTKALTAAAMAALSDQLAQRLTRAPGGGVNYRRTAAVALYGFLYAGPVSHYWQARRWRRGQGAYGPGCPSCCSRYLLGRLPHRLCHAHPPVPNTTSLTAGVAGAAVPQPQGPAAAAEEGAA